MKYPSLFAGARVGLAVVALSGFALASQAQTKPDPVMLKAAPLITRLETAIAAKDKFVAGDMLAELEALIPKDARMARFRERVGGLPGPKMNLTVDLGGGVKMEFVAVRPGTFMMGSTRSDNEKPVREVTIAKPFYMGKHEVTQEQWEQIMGDNPSYFKDPKNPVEQVNWEDCRDFLAKLNKKVPGRAFRFPTEAEWEYACRAGSTNDYCFGNSETVLREYAWYIGNETGRPHAVGQKKPNAWGLYDMHGNVWEWCQDFYHGTYEGAPTDGSAWIEGGTTNRVARGGSWYSSASYVRSAYRGRPALGYRGVVYGLRLVVPVGAASR